MQQEFRIILGAGDHVGVCFCGYLVLSVFEKLNTVLVAAFTIFCNLRIFLVQVIMWMFAFVQS